jgi:hypothetical protein
LHLLLEVESDICELLLDVKDDFMLISGGEGVTTLSEDLHEIASQVTACQVEAEDGVWEGASLVDGDSVGDTITRVHDNTGSSSRGIEGQCGLHGDVQLGSVEGLEHNLGHLLSVGFGVAGSLGQEEGMLLRSSTELCNIKSGS